MNYFNKKELLNSLLNLESKLQNFDKNKANPLKLAVALLDIECDFYQAKRDSLIKLDTFDALYSIWNESRNVESVKDESKLLDCIDLIMKELNVSEDKFNEYLNDVEEFIV